MTIAARSLGMPRARWRWDIYAGGAWGICDRCSGRFRRKALQKEWDNLIVCSRCLDPRPPTMDPPDVYPEGIPFTDARPPQDDGDRLQDDSYLLAASGTMGATDGTYPVYGNGQQVPIGAFSPQNVAVTPIPSTLPLVDQVADDTTLRTGKIFAPTVPYVLGTGTSPGPVPFTGPPVPPFTGSD